MSAIIERIQAMLERTGNTNLLQKQDVDLEKERLQLEATIKGSDSIKAVGPFIPSNMNEELNKAAREYAKTKKEFEEKQLEIELPMGAYFMSIDAFIAGAKWQAEQDKETIELAEDHAYFAGKEKLREALLEWARNEADKSFNSFAREELGMEAREKGLAFERLIKHIESL